MLWLLLAILPTEPWPVSYVDCIEVNTVVDAEGERRFTQLLWVDVGGPNEIRDWDWYDPAMLPVGGWSLFGRRGVIQAVHVTHRQPIMSRTYHDPEVHRRTIQPLMFRRRLPGIE